MRYAVALLVVVLLAAVIATVATSRTRAEPTPTMRATYERPVSEPDPWWMWTGRPLPPPPVPPAE